MAGAKRSPENPILIPDPAAPWEAEAAFNPSVVEAKDGNIHMFFRAAGAKTSVNGMEVEVSSIGHAVGKNAVSFGRHTELVTPTEPWEQYGCEDPRVTEFEGRYYIFYTAVSEFSANGIKVAVAISRDFKTIDEKHLVTPFNAKAMTLFPERVNGKLAALITVNTDRPPARICLALFDHIEDMWSKEYWDAWYKDFEKHAIDIEQNEKDQIEVGSTPLKTKEGWLIFYSYIYNYFAPPPIFGIQAALLDLKDPQKIVGEVKRPFIVPQEEYELYGRVPHIVFPSGALIKGSDVHLYYGAADTTSCVATFKKKELLEQLIFTAERQLRRFEGNPIIAPIAEHAWESQATFNPAAIYEDGKVHILYRAMSGDNTSVIGYASSPDGVDIGERSPEPVYTPRVDFEQKIVSGGNSGCEDPRITKIGDRIYMCYTAFDGKDPPRVAFTSIAAEDFVSHRWNWAAPVLISPPNMDDKDAALFSKKIGGKYVFLHRLGSEIWIDRVDDLEFKDGKYLGGQVLMRPRDTAWDSRRIGIAAPPVETRYGWLLLYHGISRRTGHYNVRAALLDKNDPSKILYRTHDPLFEPTTAYEKQGIVPNVVFPCGAVILRHQLYVYYGGADKVVGVASIDVDLLVEGLVREAKFGNN
jgi:beta-1,2-mannobiose phosphorylase / 1,2-beta-oligomannan phosphorylase